MICLHKTTSAQQY